MCMGLIFNTDVMKSLFKMTLFLFFTIAKYLWDDSFENVFLYYMILPWYLLCPNNL